ncbi:hypothetical protein N665_0295s0015 [Sinapis alba]|nr:hypothetical protein N665_0295s0015 [Sinapis alba]
MAGRKKQKQTRSPLPSQYQFVPRMTDPPPLPNRQSPPTVSDYPPPRQLFQHSPPQPQATSAPLPQTSPPPQPRPSETSATQHSPSSSHAQNTSSTEGPEPDEPDFNQPPPVEPSLSDERLRVLNALLSQPGRERYTQTLSPTFEPGTTWLVTYGSQF